jgi:hypothetical protein
VIARTCGKKCGYAAWGGSLQDSLAMAGDIVGDSLVGSVIVLIKN